MATRVIADLGDSVLLEDEMGNRSEVMKPGAPPPSTPPPMDAFEVIPEPWRTVRPSGMDREGFPLPGTPQARTLAPMPKPVPRPSPRASTLGSVTGSWGEPQAAPPAPERRTDGIFAGGGAQAEAGRSTGNPFRELDAATRMQLGGLDQSVAAAQETAKMRGGALQAQADEIDRVDRSVADFDQAEQARRAERQRILEAEEAEVAKLAVEPDGGFWKGKSTGTRVLSALFNAMGAYSSAVSGGPNYALQIMDSAIDRHINAQRAQIAGRKESLARMERRHGDMDTWAARTRASLLEQGDRRLQKMAVLAKGPEEQARVREMSAAVQQKKGEVLQAAAEKKLALQAATSKAVDPRTMIHGLGQVADPTRAKDLTEKEAAVRYLVPALDDLMSSARSAKGTEARAVAEGKVQAIIGNLMLQYPTVIKSDKDAALFERLMANPAEFFQLHNQKRLEQFQKGLVDSHSAQLKASGLPGVTIERYRERQLPPQGGSR